MPKVGEISARRALFAFLLVCMATSWTHAQENLNGQNIILGNQPTAIQAKENYLRLVEAQKKEREDFRIEDCDFLGSRNYKCIGTSKTIRRADGATIMTVRDGGIAYYVAPFPIILPGKIPVSISTGKPVFHWVPINEAFDGGRVLDQWKQLSRDGKFFDCRDGTCSVLLRNVDQNIERITACSIAVINHQFGAPTDCFPVAIITSEGTWVRVVAGFHKGGADNRGKPDFDLLINFQNHPIASSAIADTLKAVQQALSNAPLSLATTVTQLSALGVGGQRVSPILHPTRELLTLRVDVGNFDTRRFDSPISNLGLVISSTLYVNKQNTTRPEDWHLPTTQQEESYMSEFKAILKRSLQSMCRASHWRDDLTLTCEK